MSTDYTILRERIIALEAENAAMKLQQIEITQAKELYLKIFEEFPALIWRARLDKLCDYFNKTWLEFTGRTMEQEFGNGWAEGVHPDDFDACLHTYSNAFDNREAFVMEYRMKNKFGDYRWIRDFGRPFYDVDNSFIGYIGSCYDITEIKDNELALKELNNTKDKFLSIIAHDLKNPFNNMLGFAKLLNENYTKYSARELEAITSQLYSSAKQTYSLLENLLDWARTQSNTIPFNPEPLDFETIYPEILETVALSAAAKQIEINCHNQEVKTIYADSNMFATILRNLISNAIKFTHQNGSIHIYVTKTEANIVFHIADDGVGMDQEHIDNLFNPGEKKSTKGTKGEKGTGLGLILCKEFIEKHGGKIWVNSTKEKGSDFYFSLPASNITDSVYII
ncbi:PAS domain-containing sensor histidine kinase [Limnovirga soli]|uniref:histidine kinase n=1 Tax=Limnovirga soli TaxID=2656915 RepID=A0A8J8FF35_9BACT|nr:PAS domain-containing sensor histidine kinase [Limnovirga soli]NNV55432.1 PAS domain-containing protein [Limnovirga soli]